jgi:hypothetical protein
MEKEIQTIVKKMKSNGDIYTPKDGRFRLVN